MSIAIKDRKIIKSLYFEKRYSYTAIGKMFNVSRQRIHQIVKAYKSFSTHNYSFANIPLNINICAKCDNKAEEIHHIDKDVNNNNARNLMPLCKNCHNEIHTSLIGKKRRKYKFKKEGTP